MLRYKLNKIKEIPLDQKIILTLDHSVSSANIAGRTFSYFFDDVRQLYFSYFIDFTENKGTKRLYQAKSESSSLNKVDFLPKSYFEIVNFPNIFDDLKVKRETLKDLWFEKSKIRNAHNGIIFFEDTNLTLSFVKHQLDDYLKENENNKYTLYNPTVYIPFILNHEINDVVSFCRDNLINLIVVDFINSYFEEETEKSNFKKEIKRKINFKENIDIELHQKELENLHSIGGVFETSTNSLLIHNLDNMVSHIMKNHDFYSSKNRANFKSFLNKINLNMTKDWKEEDRINFISFYLRSLMNVSGDSLLSVITSTSFSVSFDELTKIYNKCFKKGLIKELLNLNKWGTWVASQRWVFTDKLKFINDLIEKNTIEFSFNNLNFLNISYISDITSATHFLISYNMLKRDFPHLCKLLVNHIQDNTHLLDKIYNEISLEELKEIKEVFKISSFDSKNFIKNYNFHLFIKNLGWRTFTNFRESLYKMPSSLILNVLKLENQGEEIHQFYKKEINDLINKKDDISEELLNFIFQHTEKPIDGDVFVYKQMLKRDFKLLKQCIQSPKINISKKTMDLMKLKLLILKDKPEVSDIYKLLG